jgi:transcriptional regulator with XRE-family HTH domain
MKRWENLKYQRISGVKLENDHYLVEFDDGETVRLPVKSLVPSNVQKYYAADFTFNSFELIIPAVPYDIEVPWDKIRVSADIEFSRHMAFKAEEQAKKVGDRLRQLRERKGIKANELADRSGLTPQTISRIENAKTDVPFQTLQKILTAMGCDLKDLVQYEETTTRTMSQLLKRLAKAGVDVNLLKSRIWPDALQKALSQCAGELPEMLLNEAIIYVSSIFGWSSEEILGSEDLRLSSRAAALALYKRPGNSNANQIKAYSHYAFRLAQITLHASISEKKMEYPSDIDLFKATLHKNYGPVTLENLLDYTWDLGICVLPLSDSGIFHGASWNIENRHVVVLKQNTQSHSRWIFDLLHELYHVFAHLTQPDSAVIEIDELTPFSNQDKPEEREANSFANQVVLNGKAEDLAQKCVAAAGNIENLKNAVEKVAKQENIRVDFLSNYIAFRLGYQGENWWPTAQKLQVTEPDPLDIVQKRLHKRVNRLKLNPIENTLLSNALN